MLESELRVELGKVAKLGIYSADVVVNSGYQLEWRPWERPIVTEFRNNGLDPKRLFLFGRKGLDHKLGQPIALPINIIDPRGRETCGYYIGVYLATAEESSDLMFARVTEKVNRIMTDYYSGRDRTRHYADSILVAHPKLDELWSRKRMFPTTEAAASLLHDPERLEKRMRIYRQAAEVFMDDLFTQVLRAVSLLGISRPFNLIDDAKHAVAMEGQAVNLFFGRLY